MGIAFQNGTVHESARVALIGITADVFLNLSPIGGGKFPFQSRRETGAAAASESAVQNDLNDFIRCHPGQHPSQGFIAAGTDIFIDVFRVDNTAVSQCDTVLFFIKVRFRKGFNALIGQCLIINKTFDHTAFKEMFTDNFRNILFLHHGIEYRIRINDHNRSQGA